jgi:hypothetical protein
MSMRHHNKVVDPNAVYWAVPPIERQHIMYAIDNNILASTVPKVRKDNHWKTKHHPDQNIPANIYLLGKGTKAELRERYENKFGPILEENNVRSSTCQFGDYMRELVQQGLLVPLRE